VRTYVHVFRSSLFVRNIKANFELLHLYVFRMFLKLLLY